MSRLSCGPATLMRHLTCAVALSQHESAESADAPSSRGDIACRVIVSAHCNHQTGPAMRRRWSRAVEPAALHM